MPKINQEEYEILKGLDDRFKWIARNSEGYCGGNLFSHSEKPIKLSYFGEWGYGGWFRPIDNHLFEFIQWEDDEPYNIAELIENFEEAVRINEIFEKSTKIGLKKSEETEVKKDIEWLKEELNYFIKSEILDEREIGFELAIREVIDLLNQLDESEVLSEYWIEQKSIDTHVDTLSGEIQVTFRLDDLQRIIVPKQEEMKVPKMWHDVIVQNKEDGHSLRWTLNYIDNLNVNDVDSFARAWIAYPNIEVKKEQKYHALIKGHENIVSDDKYWNYCIAGESLDIGDNKVHTDVLAEYVLSATKDEWENLGISDDNADFVKVEEMEK